MKKLKEHIKENYESQSAFGRANNKERGQVFRYLSQELMLHEGVLYRVVARGIK
jgi:hypothetical protein